MPPPATPTAPLLNLPQDETKGGPMRMLMRLRALKKSQQRADFEALLESAEKEGLSPGDVLALLRDA